MWLRQTLGARTLPPQVARLEASIKDARAATDKVQKDYNALSEKVGGNVGVHTNVCNVCKECDRVCVCTGCNR